MVMGGALHLQRKKMRVYYWLFDVALRKSVFSMPCMGRSRTLHSSTLEPNTTLHLQSLLAVQTQLHHNIF